MKQAVVLCAGRGSRLGKLTENTPKAMLPIAGKPIVRHTVDKLLESGFHQIVLVIGPTMHQFNELFAGDTHVKLCVQERPTGTAHALLCAQQLLKDEFLLTYGDVWAATEDYAGMRSVGTSEGQQVGVISSDRPSGSAVYLKNNLVERVVEKPSWPGDPDTRWNGSGLFALRHEFLSVCQRVEKSARNEAELSSAVQLAIDEGQRFVPYLLQHKPIDIGNHQRYQSLCETFKNT